MTARETISMNQESLAMVIFRNRAELSLGLETKGDQGFTEGAFLDLLDLPGLPVCLPSSLSDVAGGVTAVNAQLQRLRAGPARVRLPGPLDRRARVHGTVLHPGESLPRAVPDNHTLRIRLMTHAPAMALFTSLLLMDRRTDLPLRLVDRGAGPLVRWGVDVVGPLVEVEWPGDADDASPPSSSDSPGGADATSLPSQNDRP